MKAPHLESLVQEIENEHTQVEQDLLSQVYFDLYCELSTLCGKGQTHILASDLWDQCQQVVKNNRTHKIGTIYMRLLNRYYMQQGKVTDVPAEGIVPVHSIIEDLSLLKDVCLEIYEECLQSVVVHTIQEYRT